MIEIIKLDATNSTNDHLKEKLSTINKKKTIIAYTYNQKKGKGQRNKEWISEPFKNLSLSLLIFPKNLLTKDIFYVNIFASVLLIDFFKKEKIKRLQIKWPNDILSYNKKFCGILCESIINKHLVNKLIIGIGINVNQISFEGLPNASSMRKILKKEINLDSFTNRLIESIKKSISIFEDTPKIKSFKIFNNYLDNLYGYGTIKSYKISGGNKIQAEIVGLHRDGSLKVKLINGEIKKYNFNDIQLIF